jgi:hypothetical protein
MNFQKRGYKCKSCDSVSRKEYYKKNSERIKERVKKYNESNSEKIKDYKAKYNDENYNTEYHKQYRLENKDSISQKRKDYYQKNKENIKKKVKEYVSNNADQIAKRNKDNREQNKDWINEKNRKYVKERKSSDSLYRLKCAIRSLISQSFKGHFTKKSKKTIEILGCDFKTFSEYIESQFTEDMNWGNYAEYWQLDHKVPISWAENEEEVYKLNHYSNFQPLHWKQNIQKGNRWSD